MAVWFLKDQNLSGHNLSLSEAYTNIAPYKDVCKAKTILNCQKEIHL